MAANINASFKDVCAILNIPLDSKGNIMFDENGNIKGLNYERLIKLARENAARNGADKNTLDFLTTDENGQPRFPMYMNSISSKIEILLMVFLIVVLQDRKCLVGMLLKFLILVFKLINILKR